MEGLLLQMGRQAHMTKGLPTVLDLLSHGSDNRGSFGRLPGT